MTGPHVLIVGAGSVGKRHARNLTTVGCRISCCDPRPDRREELSREVTLAGSFTRLEDALQAGRLEGVAICSPTAFHCAQTLIALDAGLPVLLEKPAALSLADAEAMAAATARTSTPLLLGYSWRWWPPLRRVRTLLESGVVGPLRHVQCYMSAHLADWHPWERYQDFFMAKQALGGGALLDESHWIDLMIWLFGMPADVSARVGKVSDLDIETDDSVDMLCGYDRMRAAIHLDLFGRPHEKSIRFSGESGTILWSADPNRILVGRTDAQVWEEEAFTCERNDMFMGVAREFLGVLAGEGPTTCSIADGVNVMTIIEAVRVSSAAGATVRLPGDDR